MSTSVAKLVRLLVEWEAERFHLGGPFAALSLMLLYFCVWMFITSSIFVWFCYITVRKGGLDGRTSVMKFGFGAVLKF